MDVPERICIEPDGGCQFLVTEMGQERPKIWEDFFFIEVYRTLPPVKKRFKQKIQGYVTYVDTGQVGVEVASGLVINCKSTSFPNTPFMALQICPYIRRSS